MAGVKMVALAKQLALGLTESIENAVSDVKQPGAKGEKHRLDKRKMKMHGADEEPRPESSDGRRIQAEQMPPFRQVVEASCQVSVYVGHRFWIRFCYEPGANLSFWISMGREGRGPWYPTSREKRARCGAPVPTVAKNRI